MKNLFLYISCFFIALWQNESLAQANTLVMGKVENVNLIKDLEIQVNTSFIDGETHVYRSNILEDGTFAFAVELQVPQRVEMIYSRNKTQLYLSPFDTLIINMDANSFPFGMEFSGSIGKDNAFMKKFDSEFPVSQNPFEYKQYRYGAHWFETPPKVDAMMLRMSKEAFSASMNLRREKRRDLLNMYRLNNKEALTSSFIEFMNTEIEYQYGYFILLYGNIFKNKHGIESDFYQLLYDLPYESNQIGSKYYREYLKGYMNFQYVDMYGLMVDNPLQGLYDFSSTMLQELPLAYYQSYLVTRGLKQTKNTDATIKMYNEFLRYNPYFEFNERVTAAYQKAMKYNAGSPAPAFNLVDRNGEVVELSSFRGKPVFLNFWATWCQPCMKKMKEMRSFQKSLEDRGVVFINISFDTKEQPWTGTIDRLGFGGIHVILKEGSDSEIAKEYNVRALPQIYLIDKNGNFAPSPTDNEPETLRRTLEGML